MRGPGRRREPPRAPRLAARSADRRHPLGRPGDPALAVRPGRPSVGDVRTGRGGTPPRRGHRRTRPPSQPDRRQGTPRDHAQRAHPEGHRRAHPRHGRPACRRPLLPRGVGGHRWQRVQHRRTPRQGEGLRTGTGGGIGRRTACPEPLRPRHRPRGPPRRTGSRGHAFRVGGGHPPHRDHRRHRGAPRQPAPSLGGAVRRVADLGPHPHRARSGQPSGGRRRPGVRPPPHRHRRLRLDPAGHPYRVPRSRRDGRHRIGARRGRGLPPPHRGAPGRRGRVGGAVACRRGGTPGRGRARGRPPLSGASPEGAAAAGHPGPRALRTRLRHAAHLTRHHDRIPPLGTRRARSRQRRARRRGLPPLPGAAPQRPAARGGPHARRGDRPTGPRARPVASPGRALHVGGRPRRRGTPPRPTPRNSPPSRPPAPAGTTPNARCSSSGASTR